MLNYILVGIATILLALDFALSKKYQKVEGTAPEAGLKFNALNGLFTAVIFFVLSGCKTEFSLFSLIMAFTMALCGLLYSLVGFRILKAGNMALYSLFLMSGGMLLPYVFGILFLNESLTLLRVVGMLFVLSAVLLTNRTKSGQKFSLFLLCAVIFVLNGMVSIISKCHQINEAYDTVDSTAFVMYSGLGRFIFSSAALLVMQKGRLNCSFTSKKMPVLVAGSALIGGVSYMLQLIGAKELPATVLYPLVTGGSIIFSAFAGKIFYKETISKIQWISIGICFIGTCFFL